MYQADVVQHVRSPEAQHATLSLRAQSYEDESIRPVTIKQILDATPKFPDSTYWLIDGKDVYQLTFVGQVREVVPHSTNVMYRVDDGTAMIEVKRWIDSDRVEMDVDAGSGTDQEKSIVPDSYVRVWGRLKSFSNKKHVGALMVKPVEDFNEVSYHLLEATYCHLLALNGAQNAAHGSTSGVGAGEGMFVDSVGRGGADDDFFQKIASLPPNARKLCHYLKGNDASDGGVHVNTICQDTGMSLLDFKTAIDQCAMAGHVYSTGDDDHWALLDY